MSKLRIILLVFFPSILISLVLLYFYVRSEQTTGISRITEELEETLEKICENITRTGSNISSQVNIYASLLGQSNLSVFSAMKSSIREQSFVEAFVVAYDSDFLQEVRSGMHPGFQLSNGNETFKQEQIPDSFTLGIIRNPEGKTVLVEETIDSYQSKAWYLVPGLTHQNRWVTPFIASITGNRVTSCGHPFFHNGKFAGVVCCFIRVERLISSTGESVLQENGLYGGNLFILNSAGRIVYYSDQEKDRRFSLYSIALESKTRNVLPQIDKIISDISGKLQLHENNNQTVLAQEDKRESTLLVYSTPRGEILWSVVGVFNEKDIVSIINHRLWGPVWKTLLYICLISSIVSYLVIRVNRPLQEMTRVAKFISDGNLNVQVDEKYARYNGEIGEFVTSFNTMIDSLRKSVNDSAEETAHNLILEREFQNASELQKSFLPEVQFIHSIPRHFALGAKLLPAKRMPCDYYTYWDLDEHVKAILVVDLSGRGVPAVMMMIAASALVRRLASQGMEPGDVLTQTNQTLLKIKNQRGMFIPLILVYYNDRTGEIIYCNAGHNPPVIVKESGDVLILPAAANPVLGISGEWAFKAHHAKLAPGDLLFIYTDGVTDTIDAAGETFGVERVVQVLTQMYSASTEEFIPTFLQFLNEFRDGEQNDDITIVVLKRLTAGQQVNTIGDLPG